MVAAEPNRPFVMIVLGNESDAEVMGHTVDVLTRLQIPYEIALMQDHGEELLAFLEDAIARGLRVAVFSTHYSYTDEQIPTVLDILIPVYKVITGPMPSSNDQLALNIPATGFGAEAAKNAGLFAARVLALTDPDLEARLEGFVL